MYKKTIMRKNRNSKIFTMKAELIYECTDLGTAQEVRICEE